jgi:DNA processing protein
MSERHIRNPEEGAALVAGLAIGSHTFVQRAFKTVLQGARRGAEARLQPLDGHLHQLADALQIPPVRRAAHFGRALSRARQARRDAASSGLQQLSYFDAGYPAWLWEIPDPPVVLWVRGDAAALSAPLVAVVGSRQATPAGLMVATRLARQLAEAGVGVVSGLARGIDGAAHEGALDGKGTTVAVLGCGADIVYPPGHGALAGRVAAAGAIVSEFSPGAPPLPRHFPLRNRIISGLSRAVVVVEASERSGSLITARQALEQGRDVLAVPGGIASGRYRGCHALIKDGARLVETVEDILDEIGWTPPQTRGQGRRADSCKSSKLSTLEAMMPLGEPVDIERLADRAGASIQRILADLLDLELSGRIQRISGGVVVRVDGPARIERDRERAGDR